MTATVLAVIDPTTDSQPALKRAEHLAVDTGASIHAFCCDYREDLGQYSSRKDAKHQVLLNIKEHLKTLVEPLQQEQIAVTCEAYWNQNWERSVVEASARCGARLLIKTISPHSSLVRQLTKTSDASLLRLSRCPVLLTRDGSPWQNGRILAAVTLDALDPEHQRLNYGIVSAAQSLARATGSELHLVIALEQAPDLTAFLKILEDQEQQASERESLGEHFGVNPDRIHIHEGSAASVICNTVEDINADLLVLGTVARKGIAAALLGNTAEKVLDKVSIDLLVVN